jgi:hypothetical protein
MMAVPVWALSDADRLLLEVLDSDGHHYYDPPGVLHHTAPPTVAEQAEITAAVDADVVWQARAALTAALALVPSMPLPDPAAQAQAPLTQYRALTDPPLDVVDLANKVSTHLQSNAYKRATEQRAAYSAANAAFMAGSVAGLPELIAQSKALTAQLEALRDA